MAESTNDPILSILRRVQSAEAKLPGRRAGAFAQGTATAASRSGERIKSDWKLAPMSKPEQLPMFMSAGEIMQKYQPLEGDRQSAYDVREGELTNRSRMTGTEGQPGQPNPRIRTQDREGWIRDRYDSSDLAGATHLSRLRPGRDGQATVESQAQRGTDAAQ